jgi:hypothetical protein
MSCCNCCTNTLNLGCFAPCGLAIDFSGGEPAVIAGEWVIKYEFGRRSGSQTVTLSDADPIAFTFTELNENYTYTATITDPNGNTYTRSVDGIEYDCFKFKTRAGL